MYILFKVFETLNHELENEWSNKFEFVECHLEFRLLFVFLVICSLITIKVFENHNVLKKYI